MKRASWLLITILILGMGISAQDKNPLDDLANVKFSREKSDGRTAAAGDIFVGKGGTRSDHSWWIDCKKDPINDRKQCAMFGKGLQIYVTEFGVVRVVVGMKHYPGSVAAIRLDGKPAKYSGANGVFSLANSGDIIEGLRSAKKITTRYQQFPNRYYTDLIMENDAFDEAYKTLWRAISRME